MLELFLTPVKQTIYFSLIEIKDTHSPSSDAPKKNLTTYEHQIFIESKYYQNQIHTIENQHNVKIIIRTSLIAFSCTFMYLKMKIRVLNQFGEYVICNNIRVFNQFGENQICNKIGVFNNFGKMLFAIRLVFLINFGQMLFAIRLGLLRDLGQILFAIRL